MPVDKSKFIADVAILKEARIIVLDTEIVEATGVNKTALSSYLNPDSGINPSRPFLKKFYDFYDKYLRIANVSEPLITYGKGSDTKLKKLNKEQYKELYMLTEKENRLLKEKVKLLEKLLGPDA